MALYTTEGLVLRKIKYSESSLIVDIYTELKGLRSYMVSGSRSSKSSKNANFFQLFSIIQIVAYDGDEDKLCHIKEVSAGHHYTSLLSNVIKSSIATFITEIAKNAIREREVNVELYHYLKTSYINLDLQKENYANFHLKFMIDLSAFTGFYPQLPSSEKQLLFDLKDGCFVSNHHTSDYRLSEECSAYLLQIIKQDDIAKIKIPNNIRQQILDSLILYYRYHLEGFRPIKSLDVLRLILT